MRSGVNSLSLFSRFRQLSPSARAYLRALFLFHLGFAIYALFFNLYLVELGYDEAFLGHLNGIHPLAAAVVALPAGWICDRVSSRLALLGGFGLAVGALGLSVLWPSVAALTGAYFCFGLGSGLHQIAQNPFLYEHTAPEERIDAFTLAALAFQLAGVIGSLGAGFLPAVIRGALGVSPAAAYRGLLVLAIAVGAVAFGLAIGGTRRRAAATQSDAARAEMAAASADRLGAGDGVLSRRCLPRAA